MITGQCHSIFASLFPTGKQSAMNASINPPRAVKLFYFKSLSSNTKFSVPFYEASLNWQDYFLTALIKHSTPPWWKLRIFCRVKKNNGRRCFFRQKSTWMQKNDYQSRLERCNLTWSWRILTRVSLFHIKKALAKNVYIGGKNYHFLLALELFAFRVRSLMSCGQKMSDFICTFPFFGFAYQVE